MYSLIFLGVAGFVASLLLTPVVRHLFARWNVVDAPGSRKVHSLPIPRVGGIAIAAAYLIAFGALLLAGSSGGRIVWSARTDIWHLLPAALFMFLVGLVDDLLTLTARQKLAGEAMAAAMAFFAGVHITGIGGYRIPDPWSFLLTIGWLLLCTNAVNLIDGIDGLAAGVGLFATITTLTAAMMQGHIELALATAPLAGALLGFLRYNFTPATIFLGDSGSLLIGFLLGCFGALWTQKSATILGMTAPMMALAIPLLDTGLAIARRFLRRQPIFEADRAHIHHRLLDRGFTPRKAALVLYGCCALGAIASLAVMNQSLSGIVIVLFCGAAWIGIQRLGYVEFGLVGRMVVEGAFRGQLNSQLALRSVEQSLAAAETASHCFEVLKTAAQEFGFYRLKFEIDDWRFEYASDIRPVRTWNIRVPLEGGGFLDLTREFNALGHATAVAPFVDMLQRTLAPKVALFESPRQFTSIGSGR